MSMTASLPAGRAFVVWFSDDAEPSTECLCGRVEHLQSGRRAHFASQVELNRFVFGILLEEETNTDEPMTGVKVPDTTLQT